MVTDLHSNKIKTHDSESRGQEEAGLRDKPIRTGVIKLTMAGTQDWWCRFPPLLSC